MTFRHHRTTPRFYRTLPAITHTTCALILPRTCYTRHHCLCHAPRTLPFAVRLTALHRTHSPLPASFTLHIYTAAHHTALHHAPHARTHHCTHTHRHIPTAHTWDKTAQPGTVSNGSGHGPPVALRAWPCHQYRDPPPQNDPPPPPSCRARMDRPDARCAWVAVPCHGSLPTVARHASRQHHSPNLRCRAALPCLNLRRALPEFWRAAVASSMADL